MKILKRLVGLTLCAFVICAMLCTALVCVVVLPFLAAFYWVMFAFRWVRTRHPMCPAICSLALLVLTGCAKDPVSTAQTNNNEFQLGRLFTYDDCTMYRFYDEGRAHYWANCPGRVDTQRTESCGKGCSTTYDGSTQTTVKP